MEYGHSVGLDESRNRGVEFVPEQVPPWHPSRSRNFASVDQELSAADIARITREQCKDIRKLTMHFTSLGAEFMDGFDAAVEEVMGKNQNPLLSPSILKTVLKL